MKLAFPDEFVFGAATASYQVEGGATADGRGPSVWDTFSHAPGCVKNDHTGDVGPDHYHRFREDVELMKWLGLGAYRFSVSWSRVLPDGEGAVNEKGIEFYSNLVDALLDAGIEPWLTCFHWDLPQALEDKYGGWVSRETALRFADYAALLAERLGDRVTHWFTINEFWNVVEAGYQFGFKAPGKKLPESDVCAARHHILLAHGLATNAIRERASQAPAIGVAEAFHSPVPVIATEANIESAKRATRDSLYLLPLMEGRYPENYVNKHEANLPDGWRDDMNVIGAPLEFAGVNSYYPTYVEADESKPNGYRIIPLDETHPHADIGWLKIDPQIAYWGPRLLKEVWGVDQVVISENGCCAPDRMNRDGEILDTTRLMYLRNHLQNAQRAVAEGWPLKAYFAWSLMDNFEWDEGYEKRFGLFYVNYETLERTPKMSARYYKALIESRCVV